jgi:hypothetical protein
MKSTCNLALGQEVLVQGPRLKAIGLVVEFDDASVEVIFCHDVFEDNRRSYTYPKSHVTPIKFSLDKEA